jgi:two-component system KDP operon response regulator KdpE
VARLLAIDDEPQILTALGHGLRALGHDVVVARNGVDGLAAAAVHQPDLVVLDLRLPDIGGFEVIQRLRAWSDVPVLILSGVGTREARVQALDAGADDFLDKPFGFDELRARIDARLRRADAVPPAHGIVDEGLEIDLTCRSVIVKGVFRELTPTQWRLLESLLANAGRLLTHNDLIAAAWGPKHGEETRDSLRTQMRRLRAKLEDDATNPRFVQTAAGVGYRWIGMAPR